MHKRVNKVFMWCFVVCFVLVQAFFNFNILVSAQNKGSNRLAGADRYKTAVEISKDGWTKSDYIVIARGDEFADALFAAPLAKKYNAPILLTQTNYLNADALNEIKRLGAKHAFIVGGKSAVSEEAENSLKSAVSEVIRIQGANRYETSVEVAKRLDVKGKAVIATGADFPDALSVSAVAAKLEMPILLTEKSKLPESVKKYIASKSITDTYAIGGENVIGEKVLKQLPGAKRLSGNNRYETNVAVMEEFEEYIDFDTIYIAIGGGSYGNEFADALSGAALAAQRQAPVVLAYNKVNDSTKQYVEKKVSLATAVYALGGEKAVPSSVLKTVEGYVDKIDISESYDKKGIHGPDDGVKTVKGNAAIKSAGVVLQNTVIEGDLLLGEGIVYGDVSLNNVTVNGRCIVRGGGSIGISADNFSCDELVVAAQVVTNPTIKLDGDVKLNSLAIGSGCLVDISKAKYTDDISVEIKNPVSVLLNGVFKDVEITGNGAKLKLEDGSIDNLKVNAPAEVLGSGSIDSAVILSNGVKIAQKPKNITIEKGITADVGGEDVSGGEIPGPTAANIKSAKVIISGSEIDVPDYYNVDLSKQDADLMLTGIKVEMDYAGAIVFKQILGDGVDVSLSQKRIELKKGMNTISVKDVLGDHPSINNGIKLDELKKTIGGVITISADIEAEGYATTAMNTKIILDPKYVPENQYFDITYDSEDSQKVIAAIKSGKEETKLSQIGIYNALTILNQVPYSVKIGDKETIIPENVDEKLKNDLKQELTKLAGEDKAWEDLTLNDFKEKSLQFKKTESGAYYTVVFK